MLHAALQSRDRQRADQLHVGSVEDAVGKAAPTRVSALQA